MLPDQRYTLKLEIPTEEMFIHKDHLDAYVKRRLDQMVLKAFHELSFETGWPLTIELWFKAGKDELRRLV